MNKKDIIKIILGGFLLILTSCNQVVQTRKSNTAVNFHTRKDSTAYVLKGDSILPPLKYNIDEMVDYPAEIRPLQGEPPR